jgi:serine/threonine protein kinase
MLSGAPYDTRADYFSLGTILYILLSGVEPFYGRTANQKLQINHQCDVTFPCEFWDQVSGYAIDFTRRLMTKQPEDRLDYLSASSHMWAKKWSFISTVNSTPAPKIKAIEPAS